MSSDRDILSIFAHGISALLGIAGYVGQLAGLDPVTSEFEKATAPSPV